MIPRVLSWHYPNVYPKMNDDTTPARFIGGPMDGAERDIIQGRDRVKVPELAGARFLYHPYDRAGQGEDGVPLYVYAGEANEGGPLRSVTSDL